jgi:hypothetical protein
VIEKGFVAVADLRFRRHRSSLCNGSISTSPNHSRVFALLRTTHLKALHSSFQVPLTTNKQITAFINNLTDLRSAFQSVLFKFHSAKPDSKLAVHAPTSAWSLVEARVKALVGNLALETRSISLAHVSPPGDPLLKHLKDDIVANLDTTCELKLVTNQSGAAVLQVTTFKLVIEPAVAAARRRLGITTPFATPRGALGDPEQERLRAVQSGSKHGIVEMFGRGRLGSMLLLARGIVERSSLWIYGGFLRDLVIRGDAHADSDMDVGIHTGGTAQAGMDEVAQIATGFGLRYKRTRLGTDPRLVGYFFETLDGAEQFEVQVVDAHAFAKVDARIDFDVNNLKLGTDGQLELKTVLPNRDLKSILDNIRSHTLAVLKPALEISDRIDKMRKRGWNVTFPNAST